MKNCLYVFSIVILVTAIPDGCESSSADLPYLWTVVNSTTDNNYKIPYIVDQNTIAGGSALNLRIFQAVSKVKASSCIDLYAVSPWTATSPYMLFVEHSTFGSCISQEFGLLGTNPQRTITLNDSCTEEDIIRIIMNQLGMYFEHQRPDRDTHIHMIPHEDFEKYTEIQENMNTFTTPYDYDSILSLPEIVDDGTTFKFSKMDTKTCNMDLPNSGVSTLSAIDKYELWKLYSCDALGATWGASCTTLSCQNGATCFEQPPGSTAPYCHCLKGFSGTQCEINDDDCDPNPCSNSGTCADDVDSYICTCPDRYIGKNCETDLVKTDWTLGTNGFQYFKTTTTMTYIEASNFCKRHNSWLVYHALRDPLSFVWLTSFDNTGVTYVGADNLSGSWLWGDKVPIASTFSEWVTDEPNNADNNEFCGSIWTKSNVRALNDISCTRVEYAICEATVGTPHLYLPSHKQDNGYTYSLTSPMTMEAARMECIGRDGDLAVHGMTDPTFINTISLLLFPPTTDKTKPYNQDVFVGFTDRNVEKTFQSIHSSESFPTSGVLWNTNEPNDYPPKEDCLALVPRFGKYNDRSCNSKLVAICETKNPSYWSKQVCQSTLKTCPDRSVCLTRFMDKSEECCCDDGFVDDIAYNGCTDMNECVHFKDTVCENGICKNCAGSYTCFCPTGFSLATKSDGVKYCKPN